jgi:hypothetical protein
MKFPALVYIHWQDAAHSLADAPNDHMDLMDLHEIGWLIHEDENAVKLALEFCHGSDSTRNWLIVPKVNIVERRNFKLPRPRKPNKTKDLGADDKLGATEKC